MSAFNPLAWAKTDEEQNQIILLNDSAAALEDADPNLSKDLTQLANEKEKELDAGGQSHPVSNTNLWAEAKLLDAAVTAMGATTYPLITRGLQKMAQEAQVAALTNGLKVGMTEGDFFGLYPKDDLRALRHDGPEEWFTFNVPLDDPFNAVVTFNFLDGKLTGWKLNDRPEVIKEYLGEFSFYQPPSLTYEAIGDVLQRMPYKDFLNVTNRQRPMLFTEFYDSGTARFASSSEFIVTPDDPPCCKEGFTIVKLGMSLGLAKTPAPIEGVVAHEIAHRVLDSIRKGNVNCDAERSANALIKEWGFRKEFKEASQLFGQKKGDPAACQEVRHKTTP